jgi:hypothetical protein
MPDLDDKFGNSSNHKRARIIGRKCDFLDAAKGSLLSDMKTQAWKQDSSIITLMDVSFLQFLDCFLLCKRLQGASALGLRF